MIVTKAVVTKSDNTCNGSFKTKGGLLILLKIILLKINRTEHVLYKEWSTSTFHLALDEL